MITIVTALPASRTWAEPHTSTAATKPVKTYKYKGPAVDMRWGPVQATITVKKRKITGVSIATSPENNRSTFIDEQAVPILKSETLQAQSATIDEVSGATMTSDAFIESLQAAVKKARHQKTLAPAPSSTSLKTARK